MEKKKPKMTIRQRWKARTPRFWKKVQRIALVTGAVAGAILTAPVSLPAVLVTTAGYVAVTSSAIAGMSQLTKSDKDKIYG